MVPAGVDPSLVRIEWIKGSEVTNTTRVNVIDSYDGSKVTKTVRFRELRAADNGEYYCNVTVIGFTAPNTRIIVVNGK